MPSHQSTLVTVSFIGQMLYFSHSEISLHIITAESNFGVEIAETTFFASVFLKISLLYQFLCWFLTQLTHGHVLVIGHKGVLISLRLGFRRNVLLCISERKFLWKTNLNEFRLGHNSNNKWSNQ